MHVIIVTASPTRSKSPTMQIIQELNIVREISTDYRALGRLVGLCDSEIDNFWQQSHRNDEACNRILNSWIENDGSKSPYYPCSWKGLYDLLVNINHQNTANRMKIELDLSF